MNLFAFRIRTATPADIPDILELWIELADLHAELDPFFTRSEGGHKEFEKFLQKNMADDDHAVFIAVEDQRTVGFCQAGIMEYPPVFVQRGCGFIYDIAVTESHRRQGIGRRLFEAAREWMVEKGWRHIELNLHVLNALSIPFWESLGFKPVLERRRLDLD